MRLISRIIFSIFSNALAILGADYLLEGFIFGGNFAELLMAAAILAFINIFVRPVVKLVFGPFIVLTLGLFIIVVNALTIYFLDLFSESVIINGLLPLLFATFIIGIVNFVINLSAKSLFRQ